MITLDFALLPQGKRENLLLPKGTPRAGEKGKRENPAASLWVHFLLTSTTRARTHERNEMISRLVSHPPNLRCNYVIVFVAETGRKNDPMQNSARHVASFAALQAWRHRPSITASLSTRACSAHCNAAGFTTLQFFVHRAASIHYIC